MQWHCYKSPIKQTTNKVKIESDYSELESTADN